MKHELPSWRIDNIIPIIGLIIAIVINVGAIFWWGGRTDLKMEQLLVNQTDLSRDLKDWKKNVETRLGMEEILSARFTDKLGLQ